MNHGTDRRMGGDSEIAVITHSFVTFATDSQTCMNLIIAKIQQVCVCCSNVVVSHRWNHNNAQATLTWQQ